LDHWLCTLGPPKFGEKRAPLKNLKLGKPILRGGYPPYPKNPKKVQKTPKMVKKPPKMKKNDPPPPKMAKKWGFFGNL
jgi:hypothetical protein